MTKSVNTDTVKLLEQAWKKFARKDFKGAENIFTAITEEEEDHYEAIYGQAACLLRKKEYIQAIEVIDRLIELDPTDYKSYHIRALCHGGDENFDDAVADLEKAIEIAGDRHDLYYDLGGTFLAAKDYKRAAQSFEKCIGIDNKCYEAWVGKALAAYFNKEQKAAFEFASIALKFNPKCMLALLLKTEVLLETGKKSEAEKEIKKIRALDPDILTKSSAQEEEADSDDYDVDEDAYRSEDDEIEEFDLDD
ncbi:MAG: tetratricopeptide repeat protein [Bacteroidota bacterium]